MIYEAHLLFIRRKNKSIREQVKVFKKSENWFQNSRFLKRESNHININEGGSVSRATIIGCKEGSEVYHRNVARSIYFIDGSCFPIAFTPYENNLTYLTLISRAVKEMTIENLQRALFLCDS